MSLELTNTGTRYQHYTELLELWESTLKVLDDHRFQSTKTKEKKQQLTAAIDILQKQIEVLSEYEENKSQLRRRIEEAHAGQGNEKH